MCSVAVWATHTAAPAGVARRLKFEAVASTFSQESQYRVIKSNHTHKQRVPEYVARCALKTGRCVSTGRVVMMVPAAPGSRARSG